VAQNNLVNFKNIEALMIERGKPESLTAADIELTLKKYFISSAAYHAGDFNGVFCRWLVEHAQTITKELENIIISNRDPSCEINVVIDYLISLEQT
jgi:hypothetical protein